MKILNVAYSLGKGGTERAAQNFAVAYGDLGHDSRFLYTRLDGVRRASLAQRKIPIYSLIDTDRCAKIANWDPDIVHIHSHGVTSEEFERIRHIVPKAKYLETNVFSRPSPWVEQIHTSFQLSHWCEWLYQKRSNRVNASVVVPYPVDTGAFAFAGDVAVHQFREHYGINSGDIVIGRVGQHFNGKWSTALLDAFELLRQKYKNIKLIVVNPPDSIIARVYASTFRSDIIHIDQIVGDANLATCYSAMDVFVLVAEQGESFGMVLAESLLCETPVVTLATPWADNSQGEVIGNGIGGFVASTKKDLPGLIERLINDAPLRIRLGQAGRNRIIALYDSRQVAANALKALAPNDSGGCTKSPLELMSSTEGELNFVSRLILRSERSFWLLKYSTGYMSSKHIPMQIVRAVLMRVRRFLQSLQAPRRS